MKPSTKGVDPEWYTLDDDKDSDAPVQFYVAPLNGMQMAELIGEHLRPVTQSIGPGGITQAFRLGVRNWRHIEDADNPGEELEFSPKNRARIPWDWIMEVGARVLELSQMGDEDRKN